MKKYILSFLLCWGFLSVFAQQDAAGEKTFMSKLQSLDKNKSEARNNKNYKACEQISFQMLSLYKEQPEDIQKDYEQLAGSAYYDIACYQALQGKKKEALKNLENCYKYGWSNYAHIQTDTDLDGLRKEKKFLEIAAKMKKDSDYLALLKEANGYNRSRKVTCFNNPEDSLPRFTYANPNDSNLVRVRKYFNLDSIAGSGDEISKIKNLLLWAHNVVRHDGSSYNPEERNAIAMVELCQKEERGVNCRMMAQILNECYLAMGFKSRYITCMPKVMINDCHVINAVYSNTLDKWLWVDPTFNAYVMDEKGTMLGIAEVRERLRNDQPLVLNEDANWNNQEKQTKEHYLEYYMAKNLYYVTARMRSEYNSETDYKGKKWSRAIAIMPEGFSMNGQSGATAYETNNDLYFWQSPYQE